MASANALVKSFLLAILAFAYANAKDPSADDYLKGFLSESEREELNDYSTDYAHLNGNIFIDKTHPQNKDDSNFSNHFSVTQLMTLFPSPFPRELFNEAWELQELMAKVSLRVSLDAQFLEDAMDCTAKADPKFFGELLKILRKVKDNRKQSGLTLVMQRTDYLSHIDPHGSGVGIKQIEVSTGIHGGTGNNPYQVHGRTLAKMQYSREAVGAEVPKWLKEVVNSLPGATETGKHIDHHSELKAELKADTAIQKVAESFYETWLRFTKIHGDNKAIILVVYPQKRSSYAHFAEKKWLQFQLEDIARERRRQALDKKEQDPGLPRVVQITIKESRKRVHFAEGHVFLDNERVAIIFHGGYLPKHFSDVEDWKTRMQMEQSEAVMVPNVFTFMAGTKKVQQMLSEQGVLEKFFPEAHDPKTPEDKKLRGNLARLRATFIEMHGLGLGDEEAIKKVRANPEDFVMKENLEAGNGNFFGKDILAKLDEMEGKPEERCKYIVMRKILPFTVKNAFPPTPPAVSKITFEPMNSELSIFGTMLAKTGKNHKDAAAAAAADEHSKRIKPFSKSHAIAKQPIELEEYFNRADGYYVRTKKIKNIQCHLNAGTAGADSVVLFPASQFKFYGSDAAAQGGGEECATSGAGGQSADDVEEEDAVEPAE